MAFRNITEREFEFLLSSLTDVMCQINDVETLIGHHAQFGVMTLVRDGTRHMVQVDDPMPLDRFLAEQAFLADDGQASVTGQG